jgi:dihydropyrimidine dehydrogenase (NAD+) subunit PreA
MSDFLTDAQLASEIARCEFCEDKPCREGCPVSCSPADFLMAARLASTGDFLREAGEIMTMNPFGGTCGVVCPDRFCQARCSHKLFDRPIEIPATQAAIVRKARTLGAMPKLVPAAGGDGLGPATGGARTRGAWEAGRKVAVIGAGPAGVAAACYLAQKGFAVTVFEREAGAGGACNLIPEHRLPRDVLQADLAFALASPNIAMRTGIEVTDLSALLEQGFQAVVVAIGLWSPIRLEVPGIVSAIVGLDYLRHPERFPLAGPVLVVGGGATAVDCATTAVRRGAERVELVALEKLSEMPLTAKEMRELMDAGIAVTGRTRLTEVLPGGAGVRTRKVDLPQGVPFDPRKVVDVPGTDQSRPDLRHVIVAIGARSSFERIDRKEVFYAGDCAHGASTVVEAAASGKNAGRAVEAFLSGLPAPAPKTPRKSIVVLPGWKSLPVSLETDFFGRRLLSPFLLSAAPPTDGYLPMKKAFDAGWAGGVMKTAFDDVPIHIPGDYMFAFDNVTWGNCDNVSGHPLDRVCREIEKLVKEYPDRLVAASTGGPLTGDDEADRRGWQSNTRKLEAAGAMAVEYSLSCPQGGDGTEGAIVSQNARLTAKIIDWILQVSSPEVPKLFKLTAAVTSIEVIVKAIRDVLRRHEGKKAGITLANTFPTLAFRAAPGRKWDEGVVVGMSGGGVAPISNLTLASVGNMGVAISGNGGTMDYRAAAHFLALGCNTVQFCTAPMKYGYGYVAELHSGLSHLLQARGIPSVKALVGIAQPEAITGFMELTAKKRVSSLLDKVLCMSCGNCTRCSYAAIELDEERHPVIHAERCIGCSICTQKCFAGALAMRERTPAEAAALIES